MMRNITRSIVTPPAPCICATLCKIVSMPPERLRPSAKTSAQTIKSTVEEKILPMPLNMAFVRSVQALRLLTVRRSTMKAMKAQERIAVTTSRRTPA